MWRAMVGVVAAIAVFVICSAPLTPMVGGDIGQYQSMLQSWFNHGSPDLRTGDIRDFTRIVEANGLHHTRPYEGYEASRVNGRQYCYHFWLYSLCGLPAKWLLHVVHGNEFAAFQWTNAACLLATLAIVMWVTRRTGEKDAGNLMLLALASAGPLLWYLRWSSPEAWCFCCVLLSLMALDRRRYALAALLASVAATQNQPIIFVALLPVLWSLRERHWRTTAIAALAVAPALLPPLFYWTYFHTPSLIVTLGSFDSGRISWSRTWSFLTDLNQGLLPYVPILLVLSFVAAGRALMTRNWFVLSGFAAFLAMVIACEPTTDWNAGECGIMRYAIWTLPILAWLVVRGLAANAALHRWALVGVLGQLVMFSSHNGQQYFRAHTPWAAFVLSYAPALYSPEPEIFYERTPRLDEASREDIPAVFVRDDGIVTKILVDKAHSYKLTTLLEHGAGSPVGFSDSLSVRLNYLQPSAGTLRASADYRKRLARWRRTYGIW